MPCTLAVSTTGNEDFTGATGAAFTLDMIGPAGSGLVIVSMSYNGTNVTAAPFTFNVAGGTNYFFIHFEALVPGARLQVVETCGGAAKQVLENIDFAAEWGHGSACRGKHSRQRLSHECLGRPFRLVSQVVVRPETDDSGFC
jgi:hypothetical protein